MVGASSKAPILKGIPGSDNVELYSQTNEKYRNEESAPIYIKQSLAMNYKLRTYLLSSLNKKTKKLKLVLPIFAARFIFFISRVVPRQPFFRTRDGIDHTDTVHSNT